MINWNQFTVDNGAITDLRELLFLTVYDDPDIDLTIKNETGVTNGKKLGYIDSMGDVGEARSGCDPQYSKVNVTGIQKEWELGDWEIAKEICYDELENTIAEDSLNTGTDRAFESVLLKANRRLPGDTIYETSYAPNRLTYRSHSSRGNLAVFSEIYFPWGWTATVDGKPAPIGRVNDVLRAMQVPAGDHEITFTFDPVSTRTTDTIATASVAAIGLVCLLALVFWVLGMAARRRQTQVEEEKKR